MTKKLVFLLIAGVLFSSAHGFGSLTARRPGINEAFVPLWLKTLDAKVTINDQIAVTFVDQVFANTDPARKEGIFTFSLPEGSTIVELALWINGKRQVAVPMEKTQATSKYDSTVRASVDPALLTDLGNNQYKINVYPLNAPPDSLSQRRIDFTYVTPLKSVSDTTGYFFQLMTTGLSSQPPLRTSVSVSIVSQDSIINVLAPNFSNTEVSITRNSGKSYNVVYGTENAYTGRDLTLIIARPHVPSYNLKTASYVPGLDTMLSFDSTGSASYFTVWLTAPDPSSGPVKQREAVFVIDASHSMASGAFVQLVASVRHGLGLLSPTDRFNIIAFNTAPTSFMPSLVAATPSNIAQAAAFLQSVKTKGITNPQGAIQTAFASNWTAGSNRAVFFLTDGYFNWPLRSTRAMMIDTITAANAAGAQLNSIAMEGDADQTFLSMISKNNGGTLVTLAAADTQQGGLSAALEQLMYPFIYDIKLNFGSLVPYDVYPSILAALYNGGQLAVSGRYTAAGTYQIILSAKREGTALAETLSTTLPVPNINYRSIPQLWASAKVDYLLEQIKLYGEQPELKQAVIALGLKYGIVTPYTSLIVLETQPQGNPAPIIDKTASNEIKKLQLVINGGSRLSRMIRIRYAVPQAGGLKNVTLRLYNLKGELVRVLVNHMAQGGWYVVHWDGRDEHGLLLGTGFYILVLEAGAERIVNPIHLLR